MKTICVYCGSSDKMDLEYIQVAHAMGAAIATRGMRLVYGAGSTGLMGALAEGALRAGGDVTGVIPQIFYTPVLAHHDLTHLEIVDDLHTRKARMVELADAFIALPGGYGTLEELFEVLTWAQIGLHHKPVGLLNIRNYFDPLLKLIEHARLEGFIYSEHRALFTCEDQPTRLLEALFNHKHPSGLDRWLTRED